MSHSVRDIAHAGAARAVVFSPGAVADALRAHVPRAAFAFLLGTAQAGRVAPGGDLDVAVWYSGSARITWRLISHTVAAVERAVPGVVCDLGILNSAGCVYCFEALKGRLLFCRDNRLEVYVEFYARICLAYEQTMADWRRWRLAAA